MNPEKKFYLWIHDKLKDRCHLQRIESIGSGIPDFNSCSNGKETWIELKIFIGNKIILRKEQYAWGMARSHSGGRVFVLARYLNGTIIHKWKYPRVDVIPAGEYLQITNDSILVDPEEITSLFTSN